MVPTPRPRVLRENTDAEARGLGGRRSTRLRAVGSSKELTGIDQELFHRGGRHRCLVRDSFRSSCRCLRTPCCSCSRKKLAPFHRSAASAPASGNCVTFAVPACSAAREKVTHSCPSVVKIRCNRLNTGYGTAIFCHRGRGGRVKRRLLRYSNAPGTEETNGIIWRTDQTPVIGSAQSLRGGRHEADCRRSVWRRNGLRSLHSSR